LRESREVLEQSNDGFYVSDVLSGRLLDVTRKACADTGYTREELLGMTVMDLDVNVPDLEAWNAKVARVAAAGGRLLIETDMRRKDGRLVPVEISIRLLGGEVPRTITVMRDVSSRKQAETHAREAERLREAAAFKTQFLNNAAHELATPLTPLKLQLATMRPRLEALDPKGFTMLKRNVDRLGTLVTDLLDAARLQSGRLRMSFRDVDVDEALARIVASFRPQAQAAGITLGVRPGTAGLHLECDETRLEQVLFNLVHNALKFTPRGGQVWLRAAADHDHVELEVRDTGIGLTAAQMERLFTPFTQVHDATTHKTGGTGLGLYIARGIADQHHGTLGVASEGPGQGTTFTVRLPLHQPVAMVAPGELAVAPRAA
jgi:PAS domain S-box-containing protein